LRCRSRQPFNAAGSFHREIGTAGAKPIERISFLGAPSIRDAIEQVLLPSPTNLFARHGSLPSFWAQARLINLGK
jgi:hypothetical protein